jgi:hypothetical protein
MIANALTPGAVSTIGGTGTSNKKFQSNVLQGSGPNIGKVYSFYGTVTDLLLPIPPSNPTPPGNGINGARFGLVASGSVYVHGTSPTLNFSLIGNLGNTPQTDVVMATATSAISLTTATSYDWTCVFDLIGSQAPGTAGQAGGSGALTIAGATFFISSPSQTVYSSMTLAQLTGVNFLGNYGGATGGGYQGSNNLYPTSFFKFGLTFGVSDAANLASLYEFYAYNLQ